MKILCAIIIIGYQLRRDFALLASGFEDKERRQLRRAEFTGDLLFPQEAITAAIDEARKRSKDTLLFKNAG